MVVAVVSSVASTQAVAVPISAASAKVTEWAAADHAVTQADCHNPSHPSGEPVALPPPDPDSCTVAVTDTVRTYLRAIDNGRYCRRLRVVVFPAARAPNC